VGLLPVSCVSPSEGWFLGLVGQLYRSEVSGEDYRAVQITTIRELRERRAASPTCRCWVMPAYQQAPKVSKVVEQTHAFG
jgi:hypothetical protein